MKTKYKKYFEEDLKRFFFKKNVTAVLFILSILYLFISSFFNNSNEKTAVNIYGLVQNILAKKEEANFQVIKDEQGFLHIMSFLEKPNDVTEILENTMRLKNSLVNSNTKLIYLMTPDKVVKGFNTFERGLPKDYNNETADNFLSGLSENTIEYIDLRDDILLNGIDKKELFYKTDHHWKIETAFHAYKYLVDELNRRYDAAIDLDGYFRNINNYNSITYKNCYLGSLGRKTGIYYSGLDDFTLIYPKFKTAFNLESKTNDYEIKTSGRFEESLLLIDILKNKDLFSGESDKYSTYLYGNQGFMHIKNNLNESGIKVLFIKDSLAVPLAAFLSNTVSEIYMIDPRYYNEDIIETINNLDNLNYIFLSFSPQDLTTEFFKF